MNELVSLNQIVSEIKFFENQEFNERKEEIWINVITL